MESRTKIKRYLVGLVVIVLQLIMTQVMTFLFSLLVPDMEDFPQTYPGLFGAFLGVTFSAGVFLVGWLALRLRWLASEPNYMARLVGTLIGAYLPLILGLIKYHALEAGNPSFLISILASILGFYIPGWTAKQD